MPTGKEVSALGNVMEVPGSSELSTVRTQCCPSWVHDDWQPQMSHRCEAMSKGQSEKRGHASSLRPLLRWGDFQSPAPRLSFTGQKGVTCPFMNQSLAKEAELSWSAWNTQDSPPVPTPIQWDWGEGQHSLKLRNTRYLNKSRIWWMSKKGNVTTRWATKSVCQIFYTQFPEAAMGGLWPGHERVLSFCPLWCPLPPVASSPSLASNSTSKSLHLFIYVFLNVKNYKYIFNFSRQFLILCIILSTQPTPRSPKRLNDVPKVTRNTEATVYRWPCMPQNLC